MIVAALEALAVRSCLIDSEVIACDANGFADFQLLRWRRQHEQAMLSAFLKQACKFGCEGILSKRRGSAYAAGRSDNRLKVKNPDAPALWCEAHEHWGG
jgi:ATP-dependent DNA ligase